MTRALHVLSGLLGGAVVVGVGAILVATGVLQIGAPSRTGQAPVTRPVLDEEGGLTVHEIYERDGPGVVFVTAEAGGEQESPLGIPRRGEASGSGLVLDKDGFILTNAHVVGSAGRAKVRFSEEQGNIDARVVGRDASTDLAVLKVDPDAAELKPLSLGDSGKVQVGDAAIAIGNPLGFERTVTTGIVSALQRNIQAPNRFTIDNVIQTDASVNPGNSGGPLLDAAGKVIGINAQIATGGSNGSVGIGFAIPINTAKDVVPKLKEGGNIERAFLGVTTAPVNKDLKDELNLPTDVGALVQDVVADGPADKAGLRPGRTRTEQGLVIGGDIVVKVGDRDVRSPEDLAAAVTAREAGEEVTIEYFRGGERESAKVKLGKRPMRAPGGPGEGPGGGQAP